jgi:hypothetical protein
MKKILLNTGQKTYKNVVEPIYINNNFIQKYNGVEDIIYAIRSICALHLLQWVLLKMNKMNTFTLTKSEKLKFIKDSRNSYSLSAVKKALSILVKFGIIETTNEWIGDGDEKYRTRNSMYYVNPMYFWKNPSKEERVKMIKELELNKLNKR